MVRRFWRLGFAAAGASVLPAAIVVLASGSCSLAYLYSGADAAGDAPSTSSSSGTGGGSPDGGPDGGADADAGVADALTCPDGMVYISNGKSSYCVDGTEVTNQAYGLFVAEEDAGRGPTGVCDWNASVAPSRPLDAGDALPVLGVDWCDAWAYCAWSGKHLCGAVADGGPIAYVDRDTNDQWFLACSGHGTKLYPYGPSFVASSCDGCTHDGGCPPDAAPPVASADDAGAKTGCQGGYHGLFDMSGNAWEWENACDSSGHVFDDAGQKIPDPRYDICYRRGGSFLTSDTMCLSCFSTTCAAPGVTRDALLPDMGFRCCLGP